MIGMVSWKVVHSCAAKRYGVARRSFFVPGTGCQARVLKCLALEHWLCLPVSDTLRKITRQLSRYLIPVLRRSG